MIKLDDIKHIYFLGIGGIGMSALARYFLAKSIKVAGYDRNASELCNSLAQASCAISYEDDLGNLPDDFNLESTLVVYTPAIPKDNPLFNHFQKEGFTLCKRAELLGAITKNMQCLSVAGTHGKTTISSLVTYILSDNGVDCTAFLGGISTDLDSNLRIGSENIAVVEADEFDRSFLKLRPNWAVVSSMDADHLDVYGTSEHLEESFRMFSDLIQGGELIAKEGLKLPSKYTYALNSDSADFSASQIHVNAGNYCFDLRYPGGICSKVVTGLPGIHNVENAVAAFALAYFQKVSVQGILKSIKTFSGVKRRFEYHVNSAQQIYIDDYAHHPKEIKVAIQSVRDLFPDKKLTVIFQPHLFSRTRDFMDDFAKELSCADRVMLLDIYPARELPISGVNSAVLLDKLTCPGKGLYLKSDFPNILTEIEVLMTLGAGDIDDLVEPIKAHLVS